MKQLAPQQKKKPSRAELTVGEAHRNFSLFFFNVTSTVIYERPGEWDSSWSGHLAVVSVVLFNDTLLIQSAQ